jgi:hypothetical protein
VSGTPSDTPSAAPMTAERAYLMAGFAALLVLLVLLSDRALSVAGLITSAIGSAGLLFRWRGAAGFLLLTLTVVLFLVPGRPPGWLGRDGDLILAAAALTYLLAQTRLNTFDEHAPKLPRPGGEDGGAELGRGLMVLAGCLGAAVVLWAWLPDGPVAFQRWVSTVAAVGPPALRTGEQAMPDFERVFPINRTVWRLLQLVWLAAVVWAVAAGVLNVLAARRMGEERARVLLTDLGWQEARRELERMGTWAARRRGRGGR